MSGVSELLFRHDTTDCFTETCLNHEQYASLMAPYAENDDLEVFFLSLQSCRFLMCRYALLEPEEPHLLISLPCLTSTCQCIDIVQQLDFHSEEYCFLAWLLVLTFLHVDI
jgi:hypothetical protein